MITVLIRFAEVDGKDRLGVFRGNPEDGDDPHPEHRTGAANGNSTGDPGDVSRTDRGRQRGHQGLERRDLPFAGPVDRLKQHPHAVAELQQRHELQSQHQGDARQSDQADRWPTPHQTVDRSIDRLNNRFERAHPCHEIGWMVSHPPEPGNPFKGPGDLQSGTSASRQGFRRGLRLRSHVAAAPRGHCLPGARRCR